MACPTEVSILKAKGRREVVSLMMRRIDDHLVKPDRNNYILERFTDGQLLAIKEFVESFG